MIAIQKVNLAPSYRTPVYADQVEVPQIGITPSASASGSVVLGTSAPDPADATKTVFVPLQGAITVAMTDDQYKAWGTDDSYAVDCLLANLGLVRA